jgi:hypothetical protein
MNLYEIWVDLAPGVQDLEFATAVDGWLGLLKSKGTVESWRLSRRKFGFGPPGLGEWHVTIEFRDLAQMDEAFHCAATRAPEIEEAHARVHRIVTNYRSALYRDFPDPGRAR